MKKGALEIYDVKREDGGIYICKAENILGADEGTVQMMIFSRLRF